MTYREILLQVLSEITGKPKEQFNELLNHALAKYPGEYKIDQELPKEKADKLLSDLKREKSGILAKLVRGAMETINKDGHA